MSDNTVIGFRSGAPSARLKAFNGTDPRPNCQHRRIEIWAKEPVVECIDCGSVVDPYWWLRRRCEDWKQAMQAIELKMNAAKQEVEELKAALRILRREYKDEAEKRKAETALMHLPPRSRVDLTK